MSSVLPRVDPLWEIAMAETFGSLRPGRYDGPSEPADVPASGAVRSSRLGRTGAFEVRGTPQVLRRTSRSISCAPGDDLKLCIQRAGSAVLHHGDDEVRIRPGEMALYDTGRPYDLRLDGNWRCSVMTIPRDALALPWSRLVDVMRRALPAAAGPGLVLAQLIETAVSGPADQHLGEAGVHLLAGALATQVPEGPDDDAVRAAVRAWVRAHAADPGLTHDAVARAHHMSPRTLHRVFAGADQSVSALIRDTRLAGVRADLADPALGRRSIMAIAARWGFSDQAHLTRSFRSAFGTTPAAFRRAAG